MRHALTTLVLAALVLTSPSSRAAETPPRAGWTEDQQGRSFRVGFDPGSRLLLGGGYSPSADGVEDPVVDAGYLEVGVAYRHKMAFDQGLIIWKLYHRALFGRVELGRDGGPQLRATAYQGRLVRWAQDGRLVLPSSPPASIPFPINVGVETTVGQVDYRELDQGVSSEIGALRSEIVFDLWRQRRMGSYAQLGVGPRYDLWLLDGPPTDGLEVHHLVAPFTAGSFTFHHEAGDGHHVFDAHLAAAHRLQVGHGWSPLATATIHYEAVLLAINDMPVSSYLEAAYRFTDEPVWGHEAHDLRGGVGLRLGLPVD